MTYEESLKKLETLARQMEQGEIPIDEMAKRLHEAKTLISECRKKLTTVDETVQKILTSED